MDGQDFLPLPSLTSQSSGLRLHKCNSPSSASLPSHFSAHEMISAMSGPNNWQFLHQNLSNNDDGSSTYVPAMSEFPMFGNRINSPTTTVTAAASVGASGSSSSAVSGASRLSPEGRVAKPARRRSRASRRTPTTLFNTDTANFRAMVQQFTGGPSSPFALGGGGHSGVRQAHFHAGGPPMMVPPSGGTGGYQLQYQPQQNQPYLFPLSVGNPGGGANPRAEVEVSGGFLAEGVSSEVPSSRTSSRATNENRGNVFMY